MRPQAAGQGSLLDVLAEEQLQQPAPCLFNSAIRGIAAREAEFEAWTAEHGNFGSMMRSHAWTMWITCPYEPTGRCQPTVLSADTRRWDSRDDMPAPECDCARIYDDLLYRGACTGCTWEGAPRGGENPAAEDACDHAHPGWRELPAVPRVPENWSGYGKKAAQTRDRWLARVNEVYPAGWLEAGGPIRTARRSMEGRHVPAHTPFGGYDMAIPLSPGGES